MTNAARLSVTVLNYNYGHFLPTCLDSILAQSFEDYEVLIIDDTSSDGSIEIIRPYLDDPRFRLIAHEENQGFVSSLREGCAESQGQYITVVSADDWIIDADAFASQISILEKYDDVAFVYSAYDHYRDEETRESTWSAGDEAFIAHGVDAFERLARQPFMLHTGTMIRRSSYEAVGGYDADIDYLIDLRMWFSLLHVGAIAYLPDPLFAYRRHGANMSRDPVALAAELLEAQETIGRSFDRFETAERRQVLDARRHAERAVLTAFPTDEIFRNHYRAGWHDYLIAARTFPAETIFQRQTPILLARTLLGRRGFAMLHSTASRVTNAQS